MTHDNQACRDQWEAGMRDYTEGVRDIYDAFLRQEFDKEQSLDLTMHHLDQLQLRFMYAST